MNMRNLVVLSMAVGMLATAIGCGGGSGGQATTNPTNPTAPTAPNNPPSGMQTYNVSDVQALAKTTSETSDPLTVNDNAVVVTPSTDDVSDPVAVNQ